MSVIEIKDLTLSFGKNHILKELDLQLEQGKVYGILGPNGSGKTTFLKTLAKILESYKGKILFFGKDLKAFSLKDLSKLRSYLPQRNGLLPDLTVYEAVLFGKIPHFGTIRSGVSNLEIEDLLERLSLKDIKERKLKELSGGELQRVLLARALAQDPKVLILDEPINHLDPRYQREILRIIYNETKERQLLTLIVLHDVNLALRYCDWIILFKDGRIFFNGPSSELTDKFLEEVFEIPVKIVNLQENLKIVLFL